MTARSEYFLKDSLTDFLYQTGLEIEAKNVSKKQFWELCEKFPELRLEREQNGTTKIMAPISGFGGARESKLDRRIGTFCEDFLGGESFSSSTGFELPDGTIKSPDFSWVSDERLNVNIENLEKGFLKIVPDFISEIRSKTDSLSVLKKKMETTWIANGVKLAWLIDPYQEKAYIYRSNGSVEIVENFENELSGEDVLKGFSLKLKEFKLRKGE